MRCGGGTDRKLIFRAWTLAVLFGVFLVSLGGPAAAGEKSVVERLLDILLANHQITEEQYDELLKEARAEKQALIEKEARAGRQAEAAEKTTAGAEEKPDDFRAHWKNGLKFETKKNEFKMHVGGRTQVDFASVEADGNLQDLAESQGRTIQGHGAEFRRARLQIDGTIYEKVEFNTEIDLAGGDVSFSDVWLGLMDLPYVGRLRVGRMKEPFSLEELTSSNWSTFMERGLPDALAPSRNTGLMLADAELDNHLTWAAGGFEQTDKAGEAFADSSDTQVTARVTGLPWYEEDGHRLLHLGLGYSHKFRSPGGTPVRFSSRPEAHLVELATVDTGEIGANGVDLVNPEVALVFGPFSVQGEYIHALVDTPGKNADLNGWYAYASYFITGERRTYDTARGIFDRIYPARNFNPLALGEGAWGAWEAAFRYSRLDLNDSSAGISGGEEIDYTFGLNWYLNPSVRFMFNYVRATVEDRTALPNDGTADIYESRFQVAF